jgi:chromate reductase, NAD(P)H dehydrogenase (quinone)
MVASIEGRRPMLNPPRVLGISGSLRKNSFCTAILHTIAESAATAIDLKIVSLMDIPLYNQDLDTDSPPAPVVLLRDAMASASGLIIVTPEYNYGLPGVLKNALDWASRPYGKSKLTGRVALTLSASPAFTGGVRAQAQLNETLLANAAELVLRPQIVIGLVHEKVRDGRLVDAQSLQFISQGTADLAKAISLKNSPELSARN